MIGTSQAEVPGNDVCDGRADHSLDPGGGIDNAHQ